MSGSRIVRLRAYGVVPPAPAVRYRGQDPLETMAMELLRLTLEDGSEGVAGTLSGWRGAPAGRLVGAASDLAPVLVGQDAARRGVLTRTALDAHDGNGLPEIESLADIAMWDAWGRHLGVPVWQMLGGFRERIPAYASTQAFHSIEAYLDEARRAAAMGYRAVKFHMNGDPAFDLEMVATVAAYPPVPLCQEHHRYWHDHGTLPGHDRVGSEWLLRRVQRELLVEWSVAALRDGDMVDALIRAIGGADA